MVAKYFGWADAIVREHVVLASDFDTAVAALVEIANMPGQHIAKATARAALDALGVEWRK